MSAVVAREPQGSSSVAVVELRQALPLVPYAHHREAGSMIVVDPTHHHTSGAVLVNVMR